MFLYFESLSLLTKITARDKKTWMTETCKSTETESVNSHQSGQ